MTDTAGSEKFVSIHTVSDSFEADLLMEALQQEGVPAFLRPYQETPYSTLFVLQRGYGRILVPEDEAERARRIIKPLIQDIRSGNIYVDPSELDPLLWSRLRDAGHDEVCRNAQVRYDRENGFYIVPFLNEDFLCFPTHETVEALNLVSYHKRDFEFHLVLLHYLLDAREAPLAGKWISEKDIPGGELFFRGPHRFPTDTLLELFGSNPKGFAAAAEKLHGTQVDMGDLAYRFWAFPRIPVLFVLWEGDDEFEPALNIRFDGSITEHFQSLDVIWAMVNVVCRSLRAAAKGFSAGEENER